MRMPYLASIGWALLLAVVFLLPDSCHACPTCKDTLGHQAQQMAAGYAYSILFMIAAPFAILGGWSIAIYRLLRAKSPSVPVVETNDGI